MTPRCLAVALALVLGACLAGCQGLSRQTDLLEAELRQQEDALYSLRADLKAREADLAAARREIELLRGERTLAAHTAMPAEHAVVVTRATGVRFHSLLTRAMDRDERPGDDVLNILLTPHDADGETVKLPGALRFELLDLARPEGERTVAAWDFAPEQAREHWHSGFIAAGYRFELPLPETVHSARLTLLGRLTTHDGRRFDATHTISVRRPAGQERVVDWPAAPDGLHDTAGPAIEPMSSPPAGSAGHEPPPAFELPRFDPGDQKAIEALEPGVLAPPLEGIRPIPEFEPVRSHQPASEPAPFEPPPFGVEDDGNPFDVAPDRTTAADAWDSAGTVRLLPLAELERSDRKPDGVQPIAAPLHRSGAPAAGQPSVHFYPAAGVAGFAPVTVIVPPTDADGGLPGVSPGTARVSDW